MKLLDKVQVFEEATGKVIGWGIIIGINNREDIPTIKLENGKTIIADERYNWIEEKKAFEVGLRIFKDLKEKGVDKD